MKTLSITKVPTQQSLGRTTAKTSYPIHNYGPVTIMDKFPRRGEKINTKGRVYYLQLIAPFIFYNLLFRVFVKNG